MKRIKTILFTLLISSFILAINACTPATQPASDPTNQLIFMAGYKPQANLPFVGVYVAQAKGFFAEENLEVMIEHSPGKGEHLQLLAAGKIQVTTQDAAVLLQRRAEPGLPLVSLALIGQRGQQAFAALTATRLETPKDWEGRTVGFKGTPPPDLFAMLAAAGADPDKVELVNVGFDPRVLTEGQVDVYPVFKSNEPYLIESWGYPIVLWEAADYGVPTLGLTYVTSDEILAQNPEILTRFLRAALKGIEYAAQNPAEAVEIVLQYAGPETDPDHMRFMLESELADAYGPATAEHGLGWQTRAQWQALADMLSQAGLPVPENLDAVFTTQILEAAGDP